MTWPRSHDWECGNCGAVMRCKCPVLRWSAADVGRLTGVPVRTVQDWRSRGQLSPSIPVPPVPVSHLYGLRDLLAVRVAHDLHGQGITQWIRQEVVKELQALDADLRQLARSREALSLVFPIEEELATQALDQADSGLTGLFTDDQVEALPENEDPPFYFVYPLSKTAVEVADSVDDWFNTRQIPDHLRPVWA